jgi:hypothetical protein
MNYKFIFIFRTVAGAHKDPDNLFAFGDVDGIGMEAKLQHPLDIVHVSDDDSILVDTYNHKIKQLNISSGQIRTLFGSGPGFTDGEGSQSQFNEPQAICYCSKTGFLYIADTNNSAIRVAKLDNKVVSTLVLREKPVVVTSAANSKSKISIDQAFLVPPGFKGELNFQMELPLDYHPTEGAPSSWILLENPDDIFETQKGSPVKEHVDYFVVSLGLQSEISEPHSVDIKTRLYFCHQVDQVCVSKEFVFSLQIIPTDSESRLFISTTIPFKSDK